MLAAKAAHARTIIQHASSLTIVIFLPIVPTLFAIRFAHRSMRRELKEISVKNKNNSQNTSMMVGDLHLQLQTLRHGLEKAVGQEDAVKEKEGWKARCMEAVEHLERLKHEAEARKKKQRLLEASMSRLREEKEEVRLDKEQHTIPPLFKKFLQLVASLLAYTAFLHN